MPEAYPQLKPIWVVSNNYLYKKCKQCEKIKHIDHYSQCRKLKNLIYTHGKCKICRASQGRVYFNKQRALMEKGKELEQKEKLEEKEEK